MFDVWVRDFLERHPEGTVVEIGAGLNTRFERLDNGRGWCDLGLPDIVDVRRGFFPDSERRTTLAASVLDPGWIETVRRSPRPYFLVAETVFVYLQEAQVRAALALGRLVPRQMKVYQLSVFAGQSVPPPVSEGGARVAARAQ
jgi:O-methyltransferase involved in polyketide biosynthesis